MSSCTNVIQCKRWQFPWGNPIRGSTNANGAVLVCNCHDGTSFKLYYHDTESNHVWLRPAKALTAYKAMPPRSMGLIQPFE